MTTPLADHFRKVISSSVPLIAITTPDPAMTIANLLLVRPAELAHESYAVLQWDIVDGLSITAAEAQLSPRPDQLQSEDAKTELLKDQSAANAIKNLSMALSLARKLKPNTILFIHNAHRYLQDSAVVQAIWHLRDNLDRKSVV